MTGYETTSDARANSRLVVCRLPPPQRGGLPSGLGEAAVVKACQCCGLMNGKVNRQHGRAMVIDRDAASCIF